MLDFVVFSSLGAAALFFLFWLLRRDLREWVERPKYRFLASVQHYDLERTKQR
jgi:hypothetical protein